MPTGTLIQKIACQFQPSTTAPPMSGPAATPRPATPPQMPIARARSRTGTEPAISVSESGMSAAPPMPCTARAAMSWPGFVLRPAKAEATVKTRMPAANTVRRPKRSPRATAIRMKVAKLSVYALTNHCSCSTEAPMSSWMTGSALVMTRLSRLAMNIGREAARIASQMGMRRRRLPSVLREFGGTDASVMGVFRESK